MSPPYARYAPDAPHQPPLPLTVRRAQVEDAPAIAAIDATHRGWCAAEILPKIAGALRHGRDKVWLALSDGRAIGYAKTVWVSETHQAALGDARGVCSGYYLMGVVVEQGARRRGAGLALTRARLAWMEAQGATEAFYTVNLENPASIAMHAPLGFEEVSRDIFYPGLQRASPPGRYALYRAPLRPPLPLQLGGPLPRAQVEALYASVGWSNYTRDMDALMRALRGSTWVATRWDGDALIALCRVVSDDASIAYLQDILVHPDHQRRGLGRGLLQLALDRFDHVRQLVLLTDDRPEQTAFYTAMGLTDTRGAPLRAFVRISGLS